MAETLPMPPALRGELSLGEAMSRHVSWRAGGRADRFFVPADLDDLAAFLAGLAADEALCFIGLGSNLLVRDGGYRGTIVHLHKALGDIRLERSGNGVGLIHAGAGAASPKVARFAAKHDLTGAEFLAGIPGTLGGALAMNAGCYGRETWEIVSQVQTINRRGEVKRRGPKDFRVGYRHVELKRTSHPHPNPLPEGEGAHERIARQQPVDEWFVAAWLMLPQGDGEASRAEIKRLLAKRVASQPLNLPNAGSVFRNPPGDFAARLIESCGLKGKRVGGAQVSEKHANFIVNVAHATATDIESLIDAVEATVLARTGVQLQREVRIIGER